MDAGIVQTTLHFSFGILISGSLPANYSERVIMRIDSSGGPSIQSSLMSPVGFDEQ